MPEEASFAELYKKLLDSNFDPDPERAGGALRAILRRLSFDPEADEAASDDCPEPFEPEANEAVFDDFPEPSGPEAEEAFFDECLEPSDPIQEQEL